MDLDKNVHVYSKMPCKAMWDGKEYEIGDQPVEVKRGIAEHWQGVHKDIRIEEVPAEVIEQRTPVNPLEQNNRGQAFAGLKNNAKNKKPSKKKKDKVKLDAPLTEPTKDEQ